MPRTLYRFTAVTAICLASALAQSSAPAKTPEDLIRNLAVAAQQGNSEAVMASLTASSRKALSDSFAQQAGLQAAQQAFQKALDEKFGKGGELLAPPADDIKTAMSRLAGAEVLETKPASAGSVHIRIKASVKGSDGKAATREETLLARKEGGEWKLVIAFPPARVDSKAVFARLTKAVSDGQFKERNAAMIALANAASESSNQKGATQ
jgi:hypothetical protein